MKQIHGERSSEGFGSCFHVPHPTSPAPLDVLPASPSTILLL